MSDRLTVGTITSDQLDALYDERDQYGEQLDEAAETIASRTVEINRLTAERDGAYRERAHLLAWLAAIHPASAVLAPAPDVDEDGWKILYLVAGGWQMSWHIAPADVPFFDLARVPHAPADDPRAQWDGHTTSEKYEHIRDHTRLLAARPRVPAGMPGCTCTYGQRCPNCRD